MVANIDVSYIRAQRGASEGRVHLQPSCAFVNGVQERACLSASPYITLVTRVAQQRMICPHYLLPTLAAIR